jgi:hypothetical protein
VHARGSTVTHSFVPDVARIDLEKWSLEIPLEDFDHLPQELGCSLHRSGDELTLCPDRPGCEVRFVRHDDGLASLSGVKIEGDRDGWFLREVVGLLFQVYSGDPPPRSPGLAVAPKRRGSSSTEGKRRTPSSPPR